MDLNKLNTVYINQKEKDVLYYLAGKIMMKIASTKFCKTCIKEAKVKSCDEVHGMVP